MQGVTRNPLADPGILGVNAGAALFVVVAIYASASRRCSATCGSPSPAPRSPSVVVYALGSMGREGATPVKLALAGAALTALLGSITTAILLLDVGHARPVPVLGRRLAGRPRRDDRRQVAPVHRGRAR